MNEMKTGLTFDEEEHKVQLFDILQTGKAALCVVQHYVGDGFYKGDKYKYLLITPYYSDKSFFRTDCYSNTTLLKDACLGIFASRGPKVIHLPRPYLFCLHKHTFSDFYKKQSIKNIAIPEMLIKVGE